MPQLTEEQLAAVQTLDRNVAVSAGAGSGKTRVLTERFVHILEEGLDHPEKLTRTQEILAVTFTEKAATEMRERIRETMQERLREAGKNEDAIQFWRDRIQELPRTQIGTIHSLCSSLLRMNPMESKVDPAFQILTEPDLTRFLEEETVSFIAKEARKPATDGRDTAKITSVQILLDEYGASGFAGILKNFSDGDYPTEADWQDALQHTKDPVMTEESDEDGPRPKTSEEETQERRLLTAWRDVLPRFAGHMKEAKEHLNVLTFNDLEQRAVTMLKESPELCARYRRRFKYIMVDEFQDTNNRQQELVYLLSGGDASTLRGKNLFVVGDAKQSIYRFRGADVSVFQEVQKEIEKSGGVNLSLSLNFRSEPPIIRFCNDFFEQPWDCDTPASRDVWSKTQKVPSSRLEEDKAAPLPELYLREDRKDLLWEAKTLSRRLRKLHDEKNGISYADMAILQRTMTNVGLLLHALQEVGVPVKVVDGRNFYNRQDVRDLINLFSFVADPHQDGPLLGLLRSPYFRVPDSFLTKLCLARVEQVKREKETSEEDGSFSPSDLWTVLQNEDSLPTDAQGIVRRLSELHRQGVTMNLAQFVPYMESMIHPEIVLAGQENGAEKLANYRKFRGLALSFAEEQDGTVSAFAERLIYLRESYQKEAAATAASDDAVTIMTIHKSKGLEFPVVALPFTGHDGTSNKGKSGLVYRPGKGIGLSFTSRSDNKKIKSGTLYALNEEDKTAEQQEARRLLYVALTRAGKRLIITGSYRKKTTSSKAKTKENWAEILFKFAREHRKLIKDGTSDESLSPHVPEQGDLYGSDAGRPASDQKDEQKLAPLPGYRETGLTEFTPSMLQDYEYCQRQFYYKDVEHIVPYFDEEKELSLADEETFAGMPEDGEDSPAGSRVPTSLSPTAIGHVVHRTLELVGIYFRENGTLADDDAWRQAYERSLYEFVDGETLTERKQKAEDCGIPDMLGKYRASSLYRDFAPKQVQEELNFRLPFPSADHPLFHMTGTIDALGVNAAGEWEIVDYKTGVLPDEDDAGEPKPGYAYQLALYWYAAEQLAADLAVGVDGKAPVKVAKAMLHYLHGPRSIGLESEADKDRWLERALALCQEISGKGGEEDFAPTAQQSACLWCPYRYMCRRKEN
ncbi:MAG: hypothetical protein ACFWT7_06250 [Succiniclasticum sp.]|jgi:ATP-dependent helicase/nuclease subunit A